MTAVLEQPAARTVTSRLPALDGLRGIGALLVVTTHVGFQTGRTARPGVLGHLLARGDFGVTLFFLLSGFLLYRPLVNGLRRGAGRAYIRRRALRVLPVYYVAVLLAAVLLPANHRLGALEWVRHFFLLQVYIDTRLPDGLTQMWSLCTEVAYYLALPLFAIAVARVRAHRREQVGDRTDVVALGALLVVGWAWTTLASGSFVALTSRLWLFGYLDWFALGMALAVLHHRGQRLPDDRTSRALAELGRAPGTCLSIAVLLLLLASTQIGGPRLLDAPTHWEAITKHTLYGGAALWLLIPAVFAPPEGTGWTRLLSSRAFHAVGQVSYSVFALHLVVLYFALKWLGYRAFSGHFYTVWTVTVLASLALSAITFRFVERPTIAWGHRPR